MSNKSGTSDQVISLPKGGGALHGIGEAFSPDLYTGTGNFTVPIALPPGRNGFQPQLNLVYSTGNPNGYFGLGWSLSIPGVSRKTSHGVPRYQDFALHVDERDTFILSGAEDLVVIQDAEEETHYRPRTEGLFAQIVHHHGRAKQDNYWEVRSKDGLVSAYGTPGMTGNDSAVAVNPSNPAQVFAWKLTETRDPFDNRIQYRYGRDQGKRDGHAWDQPHLQQICYADYTEQGQLQFLLVYDGTVEYWPNLGHGNWGKRIHMRNSPRFPYGYDPKRILLGDVDGDALADIVYVDDTKVTLWINESGNGWSNPITIVGTPPVTDMDVVRLVDMLGSGISGMLWSSDASVTSRKHMFFLDFTGGIKPYLLHEMDNHLGAVTKVEYAPSTKFYVKDRVNSKTRWKTPLPFPVHVVARVELIDDISRGKLTTDYVYHHGYWDGAEREFRGFGMVEQCDTETFELYKERGLHGKAVDFSPVEQAHFSPGKRSTIERFFGLVFLFFRLQRPPYSGWSTIVRQVALTYTASIVVALAAWQVHRTDLIRSPKRVLAHCWEGF